MVRTTARTLAGLSLIALTAACSSGSSGGSPRASVDAAIKATTSAGSVRETVSSGTPTASSTQTSTAAGAYSFANHLGAYTVDTGALLGKLDVVLSGSTLYIRVPAALAASVPKGKTWVSAALDNPPTVPGAGNITSLAAGADPTRVIEAIQGAATSTAKVGAATIAGAPATQYRVTVDLSKDPSPLASSQIKLIGGTNETDDVFVGQDGKLARVTAHVPVSGGASATVTTDFYGYGSPVTATLPPADQVVDGRQLLGQ